MRSPVDDRGSSCRNTSRSRKRGIAFSIPITVISTSGSVVHMRPLPSDSTTQIVPVSATAKFAPEIATRARRNASRRWSRAASASSAGSSERLRQPEPVAEEVADLGPVLVDRRHEQMRRPLVRELDDQLREVGLDRPDAGRLERLVEPDLVGRERLHLHDLVGPLGPDERDHELVRLRRVARPVHRAARRLDGRLELDEHRVETGERLVLDRRARGPQELPVGHLGHDRRPLGADRASWRAGCWPAPAGSRAPPARRAGSSRAARRGDRRRRRRGSAASAHDARISARCSGRTRQPAPPQAAADVHQARAVAGADAVRARRDDRRQLLVEHRRRDVGVLDGERAAEAAALLGLREVDELEPGTARRSRSGASPTRRSRSEWQVGWYVTVPSNVEPTSSTPRTPVRNCESSQVRAGTPPSSPPSRPGIVLSHLRRTRAGGRHDGVVGREDLHEPAREELRLARIPGVPVHLAAARLLDREHDLDPEPLEHRHGRLADLRIERVGETRDEQGNPVDHRPLSLLGGRPGRRVASLGDRARAARRNPLRTAGGRGSATR